MVGLAAPRLKYRPQGDVLAAYGKSRAFMQVIRGPLGSGKTKGTVFKIIQLLCEQRPDANGVRRSRVAAVRNTYPDLTATTIAEFREILHPLMGKIVNGHPPTCTLNFALPDGTSVEAEILFLALDREEDIRKFRGMQITFIWYNELRFIPKAIVNEGLSRCDRYPQPGFSTFVGGLADTNAWSESSDYEDLHRRFLLNELEGWEFFDQPGAVVRAIEGEKGARRSLNGTYWKVNPLAENLTVLGEHYYSRQISSSKDDWIRVNLGNETGLSLDGKPVHPEYQESVHKATSELRLVPDAPVFVGMDFGLSPAAVFCQRQPATGRWHVVDELVCEDMGAERFADQLKQRVAEMSRLVKYEFIFRGDPSGDNRSQTDEKTVFQVLRANGIPAMPASSNDAALRRDALDRPLVRMVLGGPGIVFSPRCQKLREGLKGGFCYKRIKVTGAERFKDVPDKNTFSHVVEACEYALLDAGESSKVNTLNVQRHTVPVVPRGAITI